MLIEYSFERKDGKTWIYGRFVDIDGTPLSDWKLKTTDPRPMRGGRFTVYVR